MKPDREHRWPRLLPVLVRKLDSAKNKKEKLRYINLTNPWLRIFVNQ